MENATSSAGRITIWRRTHRPEDYVSDVVKYLARETGIPSALLFPIVPIGFAMLRGWPDAAVEHTELVECPDGSQTLRTFFSIHNYSNSAIYNLIEDLLKALGVGRRARLSQPDVDFAWILLGGVLSDYANCAGVSKPTIGALLDFRLRNSDYNTVTTWRAASVEIANMDTGRVETLDLPPEDVRLIIGWAINYQKNICNKKNILVEPGTCSADEFGCICAKYDEIVSAANVEKATF